MQFYLQLLLIFLRVGQNPIMGMIWMMTTHTLFADEPQDETIPIKATTLCL